MKQASLAVAAASFLVAWQPWRSVGNECFHFEKMQKLKEVNRFVFLGWDFFDFLTKKKNCGSHFLLQVKGLGQKEREILTCPISAFCWDLPLQLYMFRAVEGILDSWSSVFHNLHPLMEWKHNAVNQTTQSTLLQPLTINIINDSLFNHQTTIATFQHPQRGVYWWFLSIRKPSKNTPWRVLVLTLRITKLHKPPKRRLPHRIQVTIPLGGWGIAVGCAVRCAAAGAWFSEKTSATQEPKTWPD